MTNKEDWILVRFPQGFLFDCFSGPPEGILFWEVFLIGVYYLFCYFKEDLLFGIVNANAIKLFTMPLDLFGSGF